MQSVTLFILKYCMYCRKALQLLETVLAENEHFQAVPLNIIDEGEQRELARQHDYYYVPTFYIGEQKVHEGPVSQEKIQAIFQQALQSSAADDNS